MKNPVKDRDPLSNQRKQLKEATKEREELQRKIALTEQYNEKHQIRNDQTLDRMRSELEELWSIEGGLWDVTHDEEEFRMALRRQTYNVRGGVWVGYASSASVSYRSRSRPLRRSDRIGFRVVKTKK